MTLTVYVPRPSLRLSVSLTVDATRFAAALATNRDPRLIDARTVPLRAPVNDSVSVRPLTFADRTVSADVPAAARVVPVGAGIVAAGGASGERCVPPSCEPVDGCVSGAGSVPAPVLVSS